MTKTKLKRASIEAGDRVFHRYADLFAKVESADATHATIRYEWPHDGKSTTRVAKGDLVSAYDVE